MNQADMIHDTWTIFHQDGFLVEIRAIGVRGKNKAWEGWAGDRGTVYGYFDDPDAFAESALALEKARAENIYVTLNPVMPDLLARANNRLKVGRVKESTKDHEIMRRRWLLVDFDPKRPEGISSTSEELRLAADTARRTIDVLKAHGWLEPVRAMSGNGVHLLYPIDLPENEESRQLIQRLLQALAGQFDTDRVEVDQKVYNAARLVKLYGTTARKGDPTEERPHRISRLTHTEIPGLLTVDQMREYVATYWQEPESNVEGSGVAGQNPHYIKAVVESELAKVAEAGPDSHRRNDQAFKSACNLFEFVNGGELDADFVEREIAKRSAANGLPEHEINAFIRSAKERVAGKARTAPEPSVKWNGVEWRVGDPGDTPGKRNTFPYDIQEKRLVYRRMGKDENNMPTEEVFPIAQFYATINEEVTDEDGNKLFVIAGEAERGGPFTVELDATIFGHDLQLRAALEAAAGAMDTVYPGMTKHLGPAIKIMTEDDNLVKTKLYRRTGWVHGDGRGDDVFLIPGRERKLTRIDISKPPYAVENGDIGLAVDALDSLINALPPRLTTPILALLFQAPLQRKAGWFNNRYAIFIQGRTGSLKTSWCQAAMCIYGPLFVHNDNLIRMGKSATHNAIIKMATSASDVPFMIDNYKPNTGDGDKDIVNLLHAIVEGGDKDRLNRNAEMREAKPIFCLPIITGEDAPDTDAASLARTLLVRFEWQRGQMNERLSYAQRNHKALPTIGAHWIDWLESEESRQVIDTYAPMLDERREAWAQYLISKQPNMVNILRVASSLAVNELAWAIACAHPDFGPTLDKYTDQHRAGLVEIANTMADSTTESVEAHQFLAALRELIGSGKCVLIDRDRMGLGEPDPNRVIGWKDTAGIYLLPKVSHEAARRVLGRDSLPVSTRTILSQLDALGYVASKSESSTTKTVRMDGSVQRVVHLRANALDADDPTNQDASESFDASFLDSLDF